MSELGRSLANSRTPIRLESTDDRAALVAIAGLPSLTPARFWSLVEMGPLARVWAKVQAGGAPLHGRDRDAAKAWAGAARSIQPHVELARHERAGVAVLPFGHPGYPDALLDDPEPPAVIFRRGPTDLDDRVRVAVVGTRACTPYGRGISQDLGAALAARGVDVVSGLASGVDAAAHAGAIAKNPARAVAVVAGGVDVIYPKSNRGLYHQIGEHGALLSEWPMGSRPETWRFPARNRLVASLSAAIVVVESAVKGGSMYTVEEGLLRNRAVFAVPGNMHSPVSAGTHRLISEGAYVLCNFDELLDVVAPLKGPKPVQAKLGIDSWLLEAIGWEPMELDTVVGESGRSPSEVTLEVERLIGTGALRRLGGVVERVA